MARNCTVCRSLQERSEQRLKRRQRSCLTGEQGVNGEKEGELEIRTARMKVEMADTSVPLILKERTRMGRKIILILTSATYGSSDRIRNLLQRYSLFSGR